MDRINARFSSLVAVLVAVVLSLCIAGPIFGANEPEAVLPSGSGTEASPYLISSLGNLYWITQNQASWDKHFKQTANITLTSCADWDDGAGWTPIGYRAGVAPYYTNSFKGSYDGQGYTITGLRIVRTNKYNQGLFGHVGTGDATATNIVIKNLGLVDVDLRGSRGVGALIGRVTGNHYTRIGKCYSTNGSVKGNGATGGLIGSHNSWAETPGGTANPMLSYSWSDLSVSFLGSTTLEPDEPDKFGGLVGCSQKGTISDCYARGSVTVNATEADPGQRVGGVAGCNIYRGEMYNSYSTGTVTTANCTYVGGLLGRKTEGGRGNDGVVEDSFWDTQTSLQASSAGGTGETTANMKTQSTFTAAGWDFTDVWAIDAGVNDGYPYIQDKPLLVDLASFTAAPYQNGILLQWETASEIDHAGFHIWRSDSAGGTHTQITDALIPAQGGPSMGAAYAYEDTNMLRKVYTRHDTNRNRIYVFQDLAGGRAYYYRLEAIDTAGGSEFFGPVSASVQNPTPAPKGWGQIVKP